MREGFASAMNGAQRLNNIHNQAMNRLQDTQADPLGGGFDHRSAVNGANVLPATVRDIVYQGDSFPAEYRGRFLMHCHNLVHEDMGMMLNFEVV